MNSEIKLGLYRHFKGNLYTLLAIAENSENPEEEMAVYRSESEPEKYWVRPLKMWCETVIRDGVEMERFKYIGND